MSNAKFRLGEHIKLNDLAINHRNALKLPLPDGVGVICVVLCGSHTTMYDIRFQKDSFDPVPIHYHPFTYYRLPEHYLVSTGVFEL
jgi:hypothetical protein